MKIVLEDIERWFLSGGEAADSGALCGEEKGFEDVGLSGLYRLF